MDNPEPYDLRRLSVQKNLRIPRVQQGSKMSFSYLSLVYINPGRIFCHQLHVILSPLKISFKKTILVTVSIIGNIDCT